MSWEASPRDMREEDAHAIAARLGSYDRTYSTEVPRFRSVGRQSEEMMPKPAKKAGLNPLVPRTSYGNILT